MVKSLQLNTKQSEALKSHANSTLFIGGIGSGKSFTLGVDLWIKSHLTKGSLGLVIAPSYDVIRYSTLPAIEESFEYLGIKQDIHYVINKKPPLEWNVKPFSSLNNNRIMTFRNGSFVILETAENYNKHRGSQYDYILADELRDFREDAVKVLVGRLRGTAYKKANLQHCFKGFTTPFNSPDDFKELRDNSHVIKATTYDNELNLPKGYIDLQASQLDEKTFKREVLGQEIPKDSIIFHAFSDENIIEREFKPGLPTYLTYDFNVDPMSVLVVQLDGLKHYVVKEFQIPDSNTTNATLEVCNYLKSKGHGGLIEVTGDRSGNSRSTIGTAGKTNYHIIEQIIKDNGFRYDQYTPHVKNIEDRFNLTNGAFCNYKGERKLFIDKSCNHLIKNLKRVTREDYTKHDPKGITHIVDALTYYPHAYMKLITNEVYNG